jgi:butyryl-CoA dehydrogenase
LSGSRSARGTYGFVGLTVGAGHLIEAFGTDELKERFMTKMYAGEWTGTMALTEPQAGSSLGDITTSATPTDDGYYLIKGSKIFISGADHGITENVVNLALARIDGAPDGTKGISLFAVPRLREEGGSLVSNDVTVAGLIHKIGWRGLPSLALEFGDEGDCRGWLVGEPNQGLRYMFQMMNEARIMIGVNGAATASAAYHEALSYALDRKQGRQLGARGGEQVSIIEHADVRRMLLRQKAIVEGSFALLGTVARYADISEQGASDEERERAGLLLNLLTPIAKTFPAERGFEANVLAIQVHGGYGYTSEYLPEAYMRDQKLNTLHEGTNAIQSMDLLGRKVMSKGGAPLRALAEEIGSTIARGREAGCDPERPPWAPRPWSSVSVEWQATRTACSVTAGTTSTCSPPSSSGGSGSTWPQSRVPHPFQKNANAQPRPPLNIGSEPRSPESPTWPTSAEPTRTRTSRPNGSGSLRPS